MGRWHHPRGVGVEPQMVRERIIPLLQLPIECVETGNEIMGRPVRASLRIHLVEDLIQH